MATEARADGFGDPLPDRTLCRFGTLRFRHPGEGLSNGVTSLAVSPDGRLVATAGERPAVVLWDLASGQEVRRLSLAPLLLEGELQSYGVRDVTFTPDGAVLAAGGPEGRVERWEVATGKALAPFTGGHRSGVHRLAFARNGTALATGDQEGFVLVRDPVTGQVRHRLGPHRDHVAVLAISDDARTVISGGWNQSNVVSVWDAMTGRLVRELDAPRLNWCDNHSIALSPDGRFVAVGRECYAIVVWDVHTGKVISELDAQQEQDPQDEDPHEVHDEVAGLAFSPDGKTLASAGRDSSVRLWDVTTWTERIRLDWHEGDAETLAFAPDGATLVAAGQAGVVRVWTLPEGRERVRTTGHRAAVFHLAWTPDGTSITSVGRDGAVCLLDPATGEQVSRSVILPRICYSSELSSDGRYVAFQGLLSDRRLSVVEATTGRLLRLFDLRAVDGSALLPCFSADGKTLVIGDNEGNDRRSMAHVYDLATGQELRAIKVVQYIDRLVKLSPDDRVLVTDSFGSEVFVYDLPTGRLRHRLKHTLERPNNDLFDIVFSPSDALLATAGSDGTVRLWDLGTGLAVRSLAGHAGGAWGVAFSPDGKLLASASSDAPVVRLWNVANGREVDRLEGHSAPVNCLAFSPDGRRLATGSFDTTVLVWRL